MPAARPSSPARPPARPPWRALGAALVVLAGAAGPAGAEGGERALSLGVAWATFSVPGEAVGNMEPPAISPDGGGALTLAYEHAVSTDLGLRAEIAGGVFRGGNAEEQAATSWAALADAGVVFRFDVLKYVPYAFGGLGAVATTGGPIAGGVDLVIVVGGGLDVLTSRARSWGLEARVASFGGDVSVFTLGLRSTTRWGYF